MQHLKIYNSELEYIFFSHLILSFLCVSESVCLCYRAVQPHKMNLGAAVFQAQVSS